MLGLDPCEAVWLDLFLDLISMTGFAPVWTVIERRRSIRNKSGVMPSQFIALHLAGRQRINKMIDLFTAMGSGERDS